MYLKKTQIKLIKKIYNEINNENLKLEMEKNFEDILKKEIIKKIKANEKIKTDKWGNEEGEPHFGKEPVRIEWRLGGALEIKVYECCEETPTTYNCEITNKYWEEKKRAENEM